MSEDNLAVIEHETELHPLMHCHVVVSGETAVIPNLAVLGEKLLGLGNSENSMDGIFRDEKQKCDFCFSSFFKRLYV